MGLLNKMGVNDVLEKAKKATSDLLSSAGNPQAVAGSEHGAEQSIFCSNCGTKLNIQENFCHNCGAAVIKGSASPSAQAPPAQPSAAPQPTQTNVAERRQEYAGSIIKCPNCGCNISDTVTVCPDCGMQITGRSANVSVSEFKNQLMDIEKSRKGGLGGVLGEFLPAKKADIQKLSLIRNFPIPNSIGDILEFMMLAIANIDVKLSKNTLSNRISNNGGVETEATISKTISNAWVSKMEQAYKKAEILFPNDPAFAGIQKMYFEKMKELKIKIK